VKTKKKVIIGSILAILLTVLSYAQQTPIPVDIAKQNESAVKACIHEGNSAKFCRDKLKRSEMLNSFAVDL